MKKNSIVSYFINRYIVPKNKLKETNIFDRLNTNIQNFSWGKCLHYPVRDERRKYCDLLFSSKIEIDRCKKNFCGSCCNKMVDNTNPEHMFLCNKQCNLSETGTKSKSWETCVEPQHPENSIYPYCDESFSNDFFAKQRCKTDMCNLCCISLDQKNSDNFTDEVVGNCYQKCIKSN